MSHAGESLFEAYLREVMGRLGSLDPERREAIIKELRAHLLDAARAAGRSPDDHGLQQELITRLGPARRLGRELALAHTAPAERRLRPWLLLGALGLLFTPAILLVALFLPDENSAEFVFILSQSPMIFAAPAIYLLCRSYAPRLSLAALAVGVVGNLLLPGVMLTDLAAPNALAGLSLPPPLALGWLALPALWQIMAAVLVATRAPGASRARGLLLVPAGLGAVTGVVWFLFICAMVLQIPALMLVIPWLWLWLNPLWSLLLAGAFLLARRPGQNGPLVPAGPDAHA
jgi:hypothetical protein